MDDENPYNGQLYRRYEDKIQKAHNIDIDKKGSAEYVKWDDLPNRTSVSKKWVSKVSDYDKQEYRYNWSQKFLNKSRFDGDTYIDFRNVYMGDLIRKNEASRTSTSFYLVLRKRSGIKIAEVKEVDAVDILFEDRERSTREKIEELVGEMDEEGRKYVLKKIQDEIVASNLVSEKDDQDE
jgi:hypothetical protein